MISKVLRQREEKYSYQNLKYIILLTETELFYALDLLDENYKLAVLNDGKDKYIISETFYKNQEDRKNFNIIGEDTFFKGVKDQINFAIDRYNLRKEKGEI